MGPSGPPTRPTQGGLPAAVSPATSAHAEHVIRRQRGVGRRAVWISVLTLLSRVLGMLREVLSAWIFGDHSAVYDAFIFAWRIPNLFRRFLGEGALATSLQSSLTEADSTGGEQAGAQLFAATFGLLARLLAALCVVVMLLVWFAPDTLPGTEFRWLGPEPAYVRELTLRVMPFVIFVCLTAAAGGALNVRGHYTLPALGPVVLNVVWIATLVGIYASVGFEETPESGHLPLARWLSWGVLAAGVGQLLILLPALRRHALLLGRGLRERATPEARAAAGRVLRRSAPLALGAAVYQVNVMIDGMMAQSLLATGGQTVHYLANRVQQFPLALVAVAATTAVFPALAALGQERRLGDLRAMHDATQRNVLFVALPAAFGLAALALPITAALFEGGSFGEGGVLRGAAALRVLAFAILPAGAVGLVARTYYAMGDFKTPVRVSCWMLALNALLNVVLIRGAGMDADGLALATTLTSFGNLVVLLPGLTRRLGLPSASAGFPASLAGMLAAAAACGGAALAVDRSLAASLPGWLALLLAMAAGGLVYVALVRLFGVPEWAVFVGRFQRIRAKIDQN